MGDTTYFFSNAKVVVSCSYKTEQVGFPETEKKQL